MKFVAANIVPCFRTPYFEALYVSHTSVVYIHTVSAAIESCDRTMRRCAWARAPASRAPVGVSTIQGTAPHRNHAMSAHMVVQSVLLY